MKTVNMFSCFFFVLAPLFNKWLVDGKNLIPC